MIGIYANWDGGPVQEFQRAGMAGALAAGHKLPVQQHVFGNALLLSTTHKRNWTPPRTVKGELLLFSGYIDNRRDLRAQLGQKLQDDQDLYAAAFDAWGEEADLKVLGQFAVVLLSPDGQEVRLSRSPLLAPPLHVWNDNSRLIVASTARAIFATGEVTKEIDEQKIADSLVLNYCEEERGWFKGARRVPVGSRAIASRGRIDVQRYYDISSLPEIRLPRDEDYVAAADKLFKEAVRAALDGFSRPAISISGGYDSQAVAAYTLAQFMDLPLLGLTSVPEEGWDRRIDPSRIGDESAFVDALAKMYPALEVERIDAKGLYFDYKQNALFMLSSAPPVGPSNLHWIHEVYARAKARGCDVLLTGQVGNATFSFAGDGALVNWLLNGDWKILFREFKSIRNIAQLRSFASLIVMPLLPNPIYRALKRLRRGRTADHFESLFPINRDYAASMNVEERARSMGHDISFHPHRSTRAWRAAFWRNAPAEAADFWQGFELLHGIPSRDPTAYRPLVEFCIGIPDDQYIRLGERRWLARRLLKGKIPDVVLNETRKGLQSADWHLRLGRQVEDLKQELDRLSQDPAMAKRLNLASLRQALDNWPAETPVGDALAMRLQFALTRGLTAARFIRYVEGRNE